MSSNARWGAGRSSWASPSVMHGLMQYLVRGLAAVVAVIAVPVASGQTFHHLYATQDNDQATAVAKTSDGGYIVAGFTMSTGGGDPMLMKFDASGALQWEQSLGVNNNFDFASSVLQSSLDDGYVIVGNTWGGPTAGGDTLIIKTDAAGNQQWARTFPGTATSSSGPQVIETDPGRYVIAGTIGGSQVPGPFPFQQAPFLARITSTGTLDWFHSYRELSLGTSQYANHTGIQRTSDGGYITTGFIAEEVWGTKSILLLKTDANGSFQWAKRYGFTNFNDTGEGIEVAANGDYILTGFSKEIVEGAGSYLLRTDSMGDLLWFRTYERLQTAGSVRETPTGNIVVGGTTRFIGTDAAMVMTDASGVTLWAMAYGDPGGFGSANAVLPDGTELVMAGYTDSFSGNQDIYFLRTDSSGQTGCSESLFDPLDSPHTLPVVPLQFETISHRDFFPITLPGGPFLPRMTDLCDTGEIGACCWRDDVGFFHCVQTAESDCAAYPNSIFLGVGVSCTPNPCPNPAPEGGCCFVNAVGDWDCVLTTQLDCDQVIHGTYLGDGEPCDLDDCGGPSEPTGACCYELDGVMICDDVTQDHCANVLHGTYYGDGTICGTFDCRPPPLPRGACCYVDAAGATVCDIFPQNYCEVVLQGTYFGDGTPCDPALCKEPDPTGACCYVDAQGLYSCDDVTQAECETVLDGLYYGDGSVCGTFECVPPPPTGACCHVDAAGQWLCSEVPQAYCLNILHGTYLGDNAPCTADVCDPNCTPPPLQMSAWFPLDEVSGPTAHELMTGNHGTHVGGPVPIPGVVGNALHFSGGAHIRVPDAPELNPGTGDMSIDFWFRTTDGSGYRPLVTKYELSPLRKGWGVSMNSGGVVEFNRGDGTNTSGTSQGGVSGAADGQWHHLAITVDRSSNTGLRFYFDGALVHTSSALPYPGSWSNTGSLYIGARVGTNGSIFFTGDIDEVEIFRRVLSPTEIANIYQAGIEGKCKVSCRVPKIVPFCLNQNSRNAVITVCNNTANAAPFQLDFQGLPAGFPCSINGPTVFNVIGPNPVVIPPFSCQNVTVNIQRPAGMNSLFQIGCFDVTITNLNTGHSSNCGGAVIDRRDLCTTIRWPELVIRLPLGLVRPITVQFTRLPFADSGIVEPVEYIAQVIGPDGLPSTAISINNLPTGVPAIGEVVVAPDDTESVEFTLEAMEHALGLSELVLFTRHADGTITPLDAIIMETKTRRPADLNGDGVVNVSDLLILLGAWGECDGCLADLNGDGIVNVSDLLILLSDWG